MDNNYLDVKAERRSRYNKKVKSKGVKRERNTKKSLEKELRKLESEEALK
jgi:hypothetical protein